MYHYHFHVYLEGSGFTIVIFMFLWIEYLCEKLCICQMLRWHRSMYHMYNCCVLHFRWYNIERQQCLPSRNIWVANLFHNPVKCLYLVWLLHKRGSVPLQFHEYSKRLIACHQIWSGIRKLINWKINVKYWCLSKIVLYLDTKCALREGLWTEKGICGLEFLFVLHSKDWLWVQLWIT